MCVLYSYSHRLELGFNYGKDASILQIQGPIERVYNKLNLLSAITKSKGSSSPPPRIFFSRC